MLYYSFQLSTSIFFVFFKQKTAYEMRISDWSSDVCSSDLIKHQLRYKISQNKFCFVRTGETMKLLPLVLATAMTVMSGTPRLVSANRIARAAPPAPTDRKSVV